ncbi:hypothetical protein AU476_05370 [Cupriavidus sp. UYMSc13B]|nr:hypothetical protein AU476_05370 [Cupriavidus sp. UYMSc13B]
MSGLSRSNLMAMRAFEEAWPDAEIVQQLVGQLPWGHNQVLLRLPSVETLTRELELDVRPDDGDPE